MAPADHDSRPRDFAEYGAQDAPRKKRTSEQPLIRLPQLVCELWLPIAIALIGYGLSVYLAVTSALGCSNPRSGLTMFAVAGLVFLSVVMPLVRRVAEAAAATLDVTLPNSVWLQTAAMCAVPLMGMMIGMTQGSMPVTGMICGGLIGGVLAVPLALFIYQVSPGKTIQIALLIFISFGVLAATSGVVIVGGLSLLLASWRLTMPWTAPQPETEIVAAPQVSPQIAKPVQQVVPKPVEAAAPQPPGVPWTAIVDGRPPGKLPLGPVSLPATATSRLVTALPASGYAAVVDQGACYVYDLHDEALVGCIEEPLRPDGMLLTPDGSYVIASLEQTQKPEQSRGGPANLGYSVWSTATGKAIAQFPPGFMDNLRLIHLGQGATAVAVNARNPQSAQLIDLATAKTVRSVPIGSPQAVSVSPGGTYLAGCEQGGIRIYDLQSGKQAGECVLPKSVAASEATSLCFTPNGAFVGAIVPSPNSTSIFFWSMKDGRLVSRAELQGPASNDQSAPLWAPDSSLFLFGGQLVDVATGKIVHRSEDGGRSASARAMLSLYHLLLEERPSEPHHRVAYSVFSLLKPQIDVSLAEIRGPAWQPAEYPATLDSAPLVPQKMSVQEVATQEQWIIQVALVSRADIDALRQQIGDQKRTLPALERAARDAQTYADKIGSERNAAGTDPQGRVIYTQRYSRAQVGRAQGTARRTAGDFAAAQRKIALLESQVADAQVQRTISGKLDDGTVVEISIKNPSLTPIADGLRQGVRRKVTGTAYESDGILRINPRQIESLAIRSRD